MRFAAVDMPEASDLTVGIMVLVAKAEREAISWRTKEALAVAKARGGRGYLGNYVADIGEARPVQHMC